MKLSPVHDFDSMKDKHGRFKIIKINPSMSVSICTPILASTSYHKDIILL